METDLVFQAERRGLLGKKVKSLRQRGKLPAIIYSRSMDPIPITLDLRETSRALAGLSSSTLITLELDGQQHTTLVRDRQYDYLLGTLLHVDFQAVSMTEMLRASVQINLVGEAPVLSATEAMLLTEMEGLEVEALPSDLPETIEVDVSGLESIGASITVADIQLASGVTALHGPEETIVVVVGTAQVEEEEEEVEEEFELDAEPEVITRGRQEEEEEE